MFDQTCFNRLASHFNISIYVWLPNNVWWCLVAKHFSFGQALTHPLHPNDLQANFSFQLESLNFLSPADRKGLVTKHQQTLLSKHVDGALRSSVSMEIKRSIRAFFSSVQLQLICFLPERRRAGLKSPSTSSQYQQDEEVWSPGTSGVVTWLGIVYDRTTLKSSRVCCNSWFIRC